MHKVTTSAEKGLPERWSLKGDNQAWKAAYGGCSTPVILGDHLYLENTSGARETEQERLLCFNADTGRLLWEYKFNVYQSDVPADRAGPGLFNTDFAAMKNFKIGEDANVQFRAEFFNVFNNVNFGMPGNTVGTGSYGQLTYAGSPRILQFGLKVKF